MVLHDPCERVMQYAWGNDPEFENHCPSRIIQAMRPGIGENLYEVKETGSREQDSQGWSPVCHAELAMCATSTVTQSRSWPLVYNYSGATKELPL